LWRKWREKPTMREKAPAEVLPLQGDESEWGVLEVAVDNL
jgi:hypothetical protein